MQDFSSWFWIGFYASLGYLAVGVVVSMVIFIILGIALAILKLFVWWHAKSKSP